MKLAYPFVRGIARMVLLGLLMATAGVALAQPTSPVSVTFDHPQNFTETRKTRTFLGADDEGYLKLLKAYIEKRGAKILAPSQRLDIVITDVDRAGNFEPWHGIDYSRVRVIRDIYPPRINLKFKLIGADGQVLRDGTRVLRDPGFLTSNTAGPGNTDPLRYEKRLIDRWMRKGVDGL